ncbi:transcriptional regulator, AraC family [Amycolatopsis marina]|uniref:Transcriptional regulator, AraC family n=1 Tax=Amycolatopsis marina TaxID=490629 RepID=A0A1I1AWH4_9PSEU|nr:AraC family transcriptional regulator [Amycolatopsis marina]SFB40690.1 transcriptional regulator, AraC family [Amycolatopsis marina]
MAPAGYVVTSSSTDTVDPRERTDYWREVINSYQCQFAYDFANPQGFSGRTVLQRSPTYQLVAWQAREQWIHRTASQIKSDPDGDYRLVLPVNGRVVVRQRAEEKALHPGSATLLTLEQPFDLWQSSDHRGLVLTIPRTEIEHRLRTSDPATLVVDMASGLGDVVRMMVMGAFSQRQQLTGAQFDAVCDKVVELLCMLATGDDRPGDSTRPVIATMVRRYVREHIADPGLSGETVARALGWSLRTVQNALQRSGTTLRDVVRDERLRVARERLQDPRYDDWTIARLGNSVGFSSASAFTVAFRGRYGVQPRQVRRESREADR